jgi:hypothetical protein
MRRNAAISGLGLVLLLPMVINCGGCAADQLDSARVAIEQRQYAAAHADLTALLLKQQPRSLTAAQHREIADDLCLTEAKIGPPTYPLAEERWQCERAAAIPGSQSTSVLREIDARIAGADQQEFSRAIADGDLADAMTIAIDYASIAGGDDQIDQQWRRQIWNLVDKRADDFAASRHSHGTVVAVGRSRNKYPRVRFLDRAGFEQWLAKMTAIKGAPIFSQIKVRDGAAKLTLAPQSLPAIRLNLNKLSEINEAVTARCGCAGRTDVMMLDTGLPIYLVRISPADGRSQILVLPQPTRL